MGDTKKVQMAGGEMGSEKHTNQMKVDNKLRMIFFTFFSSILEPS